MFLATDKRMLPLYAIRLFALIGLLVNLHFVYSHHFKKKAEHNELCAGKRCNTLLHTEYAKLFIVPNYALSIAYYSSVLAVSFTPYLLFQSYSWFILGAMLSVLLVSIWLFYILVAKVKTICFVCFISQGVNLLLVLTYLYLLF